jgi:hypothetical protein
MALLILRVAAIRRVVGGMALIIRRARRRRERS